MLGTPNSIESEILKYKIIFILGLIFLFNGILFSTLFVQNTSPFINQRSINNINQEILPGQTVDFGSQIGCQPSRDTHRVILSFFMNTVNDQYIIQVYYLLFDTPHSLKNITKTGGTNFIINIDIAGNSIMANYLVGVKIQNIGGTSIQLNSIQAGEVNPFLGLYLWYFVSLVGFILILTPFIAKQLKKKRRIKGPIVEPVLHWTKMNETQNTSYKSNIKVKSKKGVDEKPKISKISNRCPKCNQVIPRNIDNCPHCFAFLK